jgi:hypothetical protein
MHRIMIRWQAERPFAALARARGREASSSAANSGHIEPVAQQLGLLSADTTVESGSSVQQTP